MTEIHDSRKKKALAIYILIFVVSIISYLMFLVFNYYFNSNFRYDFTIYILSWVGIFVGLYVFYSWYKITGKVFSLYSIFMLFFFLFNYGQPIMWALGIHLPNEIGESNLYSLGQASTSSIVYTQILTLVSIIMFHLGAVFCYKPKLYKRNVNYGISSDEFRQITSKSIYYTCLFVSLAVIPVTLYNAIVNLNYAQEYGYQALYYGDNRPGNSVFRLLQYLFFPSLVGLLLGSHYRPFIKNTVYLIFSLYLLLNLLSGDRGSWIYYLILLIFMSHTFYKKINVRRMVFYGFIGFLFLYLVNIIVSIRNIGITFENIIESINMENMPIVSAIFEMGSSMKPAIVLVQYGWDIFPYGNSYFNSILGVISTKIFTIFNIPFETLSSWFSQEYLGISYGAGFSIIAESLVNFGPILTPLFMIIMGYIISSLTFLDNEAKYKSNLLRVFFAISTMSSFLTLLRNHSHFTLKSWFYGVLFLFVLILLMREYMKRKITMKSKRLGEV